MDDFIVIDSEEEAKILFGKKKTKEELRLLDLDAVESDY